MYTLPDQATFQGSDRFHVNSDELRPLLHEARVRKTPSEIALLRFASQVSIEAHSRIFADLDAERQLFEYNVEAFFRFFSGERTALIGFRG